MTDLREQIAAIIDTGTQGRDAVLANADAILAIPKIRDALTIATLMGAIAQVLNFSPDELAGMLKKLH